MDDNKTLNLSKISDLRYGENPHQKASLYEYKKALEYELLTDGELSYNNILDASVALEIAAEFYDVFAAVIVKHSNPSAVALAGDLNSAWGKAFDSDPISAFGGCAGFTKKVDLTLAKMLNDVYLSVIVAPDYEDDALEALKLNKSLKIIKIKTPYKNILRFSDEEIKLTPFGALVQEKDTKDFDINSFKVLTKKKPEQKEAEDMIFAAKVVKHVKSNAIVVAKDLRTIGICAGQTNRIGAVEIALNKVCDSAKGAVIASDGTLNTKDTIQLAVQDRISGIIQPAGSKNDKEITETADKYEIALIATGIRHFRH